MPTPRSGWLARIDVPALLGIVLLYAVSRSMLLLIGVMTATAVADPAIGTSLVELGCRWDCGWYLGIVENGYTTRFADDTRGAASFAFFPLLPLLMASVAIPTGLSLKASGMLVTNVAFIAALVYVFHYTRLLGFSRNAGLLAVALLCFVPQSFVFSAVYTESLFLLLLVAAMFHLRRGDWLRSGLAAAALSVVRANGVFFLPFALAWIVRRFGIDALLRPWRRPEIFVPILLAPLGLFLWWWYCHAMTGDAFAQASSVGHGWSWRTGFFLENLWWHLQTSAQSRFWAISSLAVFGLSLLLLRYRLYEEFILCLGILLLLWSGQIPNSLLRYSIVLFPVWIGLARLLDGRGMATAVVLAAFALVNGFLMAAWTLQWGIAI